MDKLVEVGILFDFYGKLLSERQYSAIELYYIHDLSLAEIGEELHISRQGVYDTLKRAEQNLYKYEEILGLIEKFNDSRDNIRKILSISSEIQELTDDNRIHEKLKIIEDIGLKVLD